MGCSVVEQGVVERGAPENAPVARVRVDSNRSVTIWKSDCTLFAPDRQNEMLNEGQLG
jgi:hypothetical protein